MRPRSFSLIAIPVVLYLGACARVSMRELTINLDFVRSAAQLRAAPDSVRYTVATGEIDVPITDGTGVNVYPFGATGTVSIPVNADKLGPLAKLKTFGDNQGFQYSLHDSTCYTATGCVFDGVDGNGATRSITVTSQETYGPTGGTVTFVASEIDVDRSTGSTITDVSTITSTTTFSSVFPGPVTVVGAEISALGEVVFKFGCPGSADFTSTQNYTDLCSGAAGNAYSVSNSGVRIYENPPAAVVSALTAANPSTPEATLLDLSAAFDGPLSSFPALLSEADSATRMPYDIAAILAYATGDYASAAKSWLVVIDNAGMVDPTTGLLAAPATAYRYVLINFQ